jgi:hypothetical protein
MKWILKLVAEVDLFTEMSACASAAFVDALVLACSRAASRRYSRIKIHHARVEVSSWTFAFMFSMAHWKMHSGIGTEALGLHPLLERPTTLHALATVASSKSPINWLPREPHRAAMVSVTYTK